MLTVTYVPGGLRQHQPPTAASGVASDAEPAMVAADQPITAVASHIPGVEFSGTARPRAPDETWPLPHPFCRLGGRAHQAPIVNAFGGVSRPSAGRSRT